MPAWRGLEGNSEATVRMPALREVRVCDSCSDSLSASGMLMKQEYYRRPFFRNEGEVPSGVLEGRSTTL